MPAFVSNPRRSASPAIAGFVYQVDVTLKRWLTLQPEDCLELECGEDIDIVRNEIEVGVPGHSRILEQIKNKSNVTVTLSNADALTAIASFCEHLALNPNQSLQFRFITTSPTSRERDWTAPGTGIETWEALRNGELGSEETEGAMRTLQSFLSGRKKPAKLSPKTWQYFRLVLSGSSERFSSMVQSVEWSVNFSDPPNLEHQIRELISSWKPQLSPDEVHAFYAALFLHVFKLLATRGRKILRYADLGKEYAKKQRPADARLLEALAEIREFRQQMSARVGLLEQQFGQLESTVNRSLQLAASSVGLEAFPGLASSQFDYTHVAVSLDGPELVTPALDRSSITQSLLAAVGEAKFAILIGEPGSGKTQACVFATNQGPRKPIWIHLRSAATEEKASSILDASLEAVSGTKRELRIGDWYAHVAAHLGKPAVLIIDDLPRTTPGGILGRRIEVLSNACAAQGHSLLATSYYHLPTNLAKRCAVIEVPVPRFSAEDVNALLRLHGAPSEFITTDFLEFINTITGRLPVLVTAIAHFFAETSWKVDWERAKAAMVGEFAREYREASTPIIETTLIEPETRELLYRLTLAIGVFSRDTVEEVSLAPPPIKLPNEKLEKLLGTWVQTLGEQKLTLSPLVDRKLAERLNKRTRLAIHAQLAFQVLRRKKLSPMDVAIGFHHFTSAGLVNQAAVLLIQALMKLNEPSNAGVEDLDISTLWSRDPLPSEIDLPLRIWLRALQVVAAEKYGRDLSALLEDFAALSSQAHRAARWGVLMGTSYLALRFAFRRPSLANQFVLESINAAIDVQMPDGTEIPDLQKQSLLDLQWATATHSQTDSDVENWLDSVGQLGSSDRQKLSESVLADDNSVVFTDGIWLREYQKPENERDWTKVENLLRKVERSAIEMQLPLLEAAAVRTLIMIEAEFRHHIDEAVRLAEAGLARTSEPVTQFLLMEVTGRQLSYVERWQEGIEWMNNALSNRPASKYPLLTRNLLITIAEGVSKEDPGAAVKYTAQAVTAARSSDQGLQLAEAFSENAIALWNAEKRGESFSSWEKALLEYQKARGGPSLWGKSYRLFLHAAGYFGSVALFGNPPSKTYVAPFQGMFLRTNAAVDDTVEDVHDALLFMRMAMFADGVGETEKAAQWAEKALITAPKGIRGALVRFYGFLATPATILKKDYAESLRRAWIATGPCDFDSKLLALHLDPTQENTLKKLDLDQARRADFALTLTMVPAFLQIATEGLQDGIRLLDPLIEALEKQEGGERARFVEAAALLRGLSKNAQTWQALHRQGDQYWQSNQSSLGFVCYFASSLVAPLKQALVTQISLAMKLSQLFRLSHSTRDKVLGASLERFWRRAAQTRPEEFRTASTYAQKRMAEALEYREPIRLRKVLSSMAFCLGAPIKDNQQEWLESTA